MVASLPRVIKISLVFVACWLLNYPTAKSQYVTIPDANFVSWLQNNGFAACLTGNQLDTTCSTVLSATIMNCYAVPIADLTGIQYFKSLDSLDCSSDAITNIPALPSTLTFFNCQYNQLDSLPLLPAGLLYINTCHNQLGALPALPNGLKYLDCSYNSLDSLPALADSLKTLNCSNNSAVSALPALPPSLQTLLCAYDNLDSLPASLPNLTYLDCSYNAISGLLNVPGSMATLLCSSNQLDSISFPATFTLATLRCDTNNLTSLNVYYVDISLNTLSCSHNHISDGNPISNVPNLVYLNCSYNQITSLQMQSQRFDTVDCSHNLLTNLNFLSNSLALVNCSYNQLSSIAGVTGVAYWNELDCSHNLLTTLPPLSSANYITIIKCDHNRLTSLGPLNSNNWWLTYLDCSCNLLTSIPPFNRYFTQLYCDSNLLTTLPAFPSSLYDLSCTYNLLTSLPEIPNGVDVFNCSYNPTLMCFPVFNSIFELYFTQTGVTCLPDYGTVYYSNPPVSSLPLCEFFDPNSCPVYWNIFGNVYKDSIGNCVFDSLTDIPYPMIKVLLDSSGVLLQQTYTSLTGGFDFGTHTGTYEVTIDTSNLPFTVACPDTGYYMPSLSSATSLVNGENFSFKCRTEGFDVGVVSIVNNYAALPASFYTLYVGAGDVSQLFGAHCAAGVSGQVQIIFTGPAIYIGPQNGALAPSTISGDTLTWNIADFGTANLYAFNSVFQVDSHAVAGSTICFTATVTPTVGDYNPGNNVATFCVLVVAARDPNEKEVSPVLIDSAGEWLTYTLHFQNTGTAPAHNIIVLDTLSQYVDPSTFQLLAFSSAPVTKIIGNIVTFSFNNIGLPDSAAVGDSLSSGYVQFKVRLLQSLPLGPVVSNTAYIFFDLNPAVITNTVYNIPTGNLCPVYNTTLNVGICQGDSFLFDSMSLAIAGTYIDTLLSAGGCDSIITLNLTVNQPGYFTFVDTTCFNVPYNFYGSMLSNPGTYIDTVSGCDSIVTLLLTVLPPYAATINASICSGSTYNFYGVNLSNSGLYTDTVSSGHGCDSIVSLQLNVLSLVDTSISASICSGFTYNGYSTTGTYVDTLMSSNGCDSIVNLTLTVNPTFITQLFDTICSNSSFNFYGINLTAAGNYTDTLTTVNGCDSIIMLALTVNPAYTHSTNASICSGSTYNFYGVNLNSSGTYTDTISSGQGCDSIITLQLNVLALTDTSITASICSGFTYSGYSTTGTYVDTLMSSNGCDSIVTLNLIVLPLSDTAVSVSICPGMSYNGHTTAGTYIDTFTAVNGCDSIVTLTLSLNSSIQLTLNLNDFYYSNTFFVCEANAWIYATATGGTLPYNLTLPDSFFATYFNAHYYYLTITDALGCTATDSIYLQGAPTVSATITADTSNPCRSQLCAPAGYSHYLWSNGQDSACIIADIAGTYAVTVTDSSGCQNRDSMQVDMGLPVVSYYLRCEGGDSAIDNSCWFCMSVISTISNADSIAWEVQAYSNNSPLDTNFSNLDSLSFGTYSWCWSTQQFVVSEPQVIICLTGFNGCGSTTYCDTVNVLWEGINDISNITNLNIQPNPTSDLLNVSYQLNNETNIVMNVLDVEGRKLITLPQVQSSPGLQTKQIDVSKLASGVYILNFESGGGSLNRKFVKQ
jgi:Leucine-rich repeat (LRR) protein